MTQIPTPTTPVVSEADPPLEPDLSGLGAEASPPLNEFQAELLLQRIARRRRKLGHLKEQHRLMVENYDLWLEQQSAPLLAECENMEGQLTAWALARVEAAPKGPKSFSLPSGAVATKAGRTSVELDETDFLAWATEEIRADLLSPPPARPWTPNKKAVKEAIENGEVIPHARLVASERSVVVSTTDTEWSWPEVEE